jgi:hypothetical protein
MRIGYAKPLLLRASALPTEGGELLLFGDHLGSDPAAIRVTIDDVPVAAGDVSLKQVRGGGWPAVAAAVASTALKSLGGLRLVHSSAAESLPSRDTSRHFARCCCSRTTSCA